ncbi:MAG: T9SS type A sorting domain-containing protein [Bacteroidota bacterium]
MKKIILYILFPLLSFGQTQIGSDIDGETAGDQSGYSVSLSGDGSTLAIGSPYSDANGDSSGSVRVYKNVSGIWTQIGADIDGDSTHDLCGWSVSLSNDGSILAIGVVDNNVTGSNSGSVRVYQNVSGIWIQIGSDIDGDSNYDFNGYSVSLSSDGSTLAIGIYGRDGNGVDSGSVRVYKNISGIWTKIGTDINGEATEDYSGVSVSLSSDGSIVAIGASQNDGNGLNSGSVRVYQNISGNWTQIGIDIDGEAIEDYSGISVSLSSDGNTLAIGAYGNDGNGENSGSVRVYKNVSGTWTKIGTDIDGEAAYDFNGYSVSLSADGNVVAIGAYLNDANGNDSGSVRLFKNISGNWIKIGFSINGEIINDNSGFSISLSSDGASLGIGAPNNDGNGTSSGHVRVYDFSAVLSSDSFVLANFSVYPNPASEFVNINLEEGLILEKVNVYNTLGQLVKTENKNSIAVSPLAKGSYFFEVITNKGKAAKQILVQ